MLTSNLVPCFVQSFKTDSKTGYEKALLVGVGCGARTDLEYAEEFAADLWNERVSYVD